jgi:hypothetical protein
VTVDRDIAAHHGARYETPEGHRAGELTSVLGHLLQAFSRPASVLEIGGGKSPSSLADGDCRRLAYLERLHRDGADHE